MKFLVDAQLPRRLTQFFQSQGFDAVHTRDLIKENATPDAEINEISIAENRVVITKDADFVQSFLLRQKPYKLLFIVTGNIKNSELEALFRKHLAQIVSLFKAHSYIELGRDSIIVHR